MRVAFWFYVIVSLLFLLFGLLFSLVNYYLASFCFIYLIFALYKALQTKSDIKKRLKNGIALIPISRMLKDEFIFYLRVLNKAYSLLFYLFKQGLFFKKTINALKISFIWTSKIIFKGLKWLFKPEHIRLFFFLIKEGIFLFLGIVFTVFVFVFMFTFSL